MRIFISFFFFFLEGKFRSVFIAREIIIQLTKSWKQTLIFYIILFIRIHENHRSIILGNNPGNLKIFLFDISLYQYIFASFGAFIAFGYYGNRQNQIFMSKMHLPNSVRTIQLVNTCSRNDLITPPKVLLVIAVHQRFFLRKRKILISISKLSPLYQQFQSFKKWGGSPTVCVCRTKKNRESNVNWTWYCFIL